MLIGRRALVVLGLPVLTAGYDFWLHIDDIETFNQAWAPFRLLPSHSLGEARNRGGYVLENDQHVGVLVARSVPTIDREHSDRQLTADEARAYLSLPITQAERDEVVALIRWFRRRYPTGAERLAFLRRAYRRWSATQGR